MTRRDQTDTYIRMLQRAQLFSATVTGENIDEMKKGLVKSNAFKESEDYILQIDPERKIK